MARMSAGVSAKVCVFGRGIKLTPAAAGWSVAGKGAAR